MVYWTYNYVELCIIEQLSLIVVCVIFVLEDDGRYCLTEKFIYDEVAYITCLKSAKEIYGEPLRRMDILSVEEYDLVFETLLKVADKCSQVVKEVSQFSYSLLNYLLL